MSETKEKFYNEGLRFECQGSGKCCTSHGEYGFVYLTPEDRTRFAKFFKIRTSEFTKKYCDRTNGVWHLKEDPKRPDCMFLVGGNRCSTYEGRPTQCRTWPFWNEVMNPKAWAKDVASFCPGVGKGKLWTAKEIDAILDIETKAEKRLGL
ncbi:MAG: YkgJ family cysteine cluster protein [Bdellovibrio sp.]|nr:YkgJ family cysteine cluster protein [Bdellovibrio sp.]